MKRNNHAILLVVELFFRMLAAILIVICIFAQSILWSQSIYVEVLEPSEQQRIYQVLAKEKAAPDQAWTMYQRLLAEKSKAVIPEIDLEPAYIAALQQCLNDLKTKSPPPNTPTIYRQYAPLIATPGDLKRWYLLDGRVGFGGVIQDISESNFHGTYLGVSEYLRQRCAGLKLDRSQYPILEKSTQQLLSQCVQNLDAEKISHLLQDYPAWIYGPDVMIQLGDLYLNQGDLHQALGIWYRTQAWKFALTAEQALCLDLRIALASWLVGDHAVVQNIQNQLTALSKDTTVTYHGKKISLSDFFTFLRKEPLPTFVDWHYYGGNQTHNQLPQGFDLRKFKVNTVTLSPGVVLHPQMYRPVMNLDQIILQGPNYVMAVSRQDNIRLWVNTFSNAYYDNTFEEAPYSPVLSKGYIYVISPPYKIINNKVYCLRQEDGLKIWEWPNEKFKNDVILQGMPLIQNNRIFLHATVLSGAVESELICLDATTGGMIYRQFLGAAKPKTYDHKNMKEHIPLPSPPVYGYGLVYVATNLGIVVAVEPTSGQICWLHNYRNSQGAKYRLSIPKTKNEDEEDEEDWANEYNNHNAQRPLRPGIATPPVVKNGKLYVIPGDMPVLLVYDAITGQLEYSYPESQEESDLKTLLGVLDDGKVVTTTSNQVLVLQPNPSIAHLKEIVAKIQFDEKLSGYGQLTQNWIYVCSDKEQRWIRRNRLYLNTKIYQIRINDWTWNAVLFPEMRGVPSFFIPPAEKNTVIRTGNRLFIHKMVEKTENSSPK